jgi:hypothetical protein
VSFNSSSKVGVLRSPTSFTSFLKLAVNTFFLDIFCKSSKETTSSSTSSSTFSKVLFSCSFKADSDVKISSNSSKGCSKISFLSTSKFSSSKL